MKTDTTELTRGLRLGIPIFMGYLPVGMAFGILAFQYGFTLVAAIVCSATALAGAGQFIALTTLVAGGSALTALVACGVVNLRYVLFSATMSPHLRKVPRALLPWIGFTLTDEAFAVNIADARAGQATPLSMSVVGIVEWVGWITGTTIGWLCSGWIGDPARWGVDFTMAAMFSALFVALAEDRKHVAVGLGAGGIVCSLWIIQFTGVSLDSNWFIVIASLSAATVAMLVFRHDPALPEIAEQDEILLTDTIR